MPAAYIKSSEIVIEVLISHPTSRIHFGLTHIAPSDLLLHRATERQSEIIAAVRSKAQTCLDYDWLSVPSVKLMSEDPTSFSSLLHEVSSEILEMIE